MDKPICKNLNSKNCFAICYGRCAILTNTEFKDNICPFRKTREQIDIENDKSDIRRGNLRG